MTTQQLSRQQLGSRPSPLLAGPPAAAEPAVRRLTRSGAAPVRIPGQRSPGDVRPVPVSAPPLPAPRRPTPSSSRRPVRRMLQLTASVAVAVSLLALALPQVTGTSWEAVREVLGQVQRVELAGLTALWLTGLWAYTFVLAASLPGLTKGQGFVLNLVGSGVSNLTPFGGAIGVGATWAMVRQYGFGSAKIGLFTVVTGVWNVLARLALPAAGLVALLLVGGDIARPVLVSAAVGAALSLLLTAAVGTALVHSPTATRLARAAARVAAAGQRTLRRPVMPGVEGHVLELRDQAAELLSARRAPLLLGMGSYLVLQGVLMWGCLAVLGSDLGWAQVTAGYACGRMLTAVVLTPGGTGFAETGAAAVLVALGGDPAVTVAGVLLFSVFTFVLEIPGGALAYLWHLGARRWRQPAGTR
jgi:uncharacterized membrane protein YbhN (UPF0104 family)